MIVLCNGRFRATEVCVCVCARQTGRELTKCALGGVGLGLAGNKPATGAFYGVLKLEGLRTPDRGGKACFAT